jgi:hypothetical protein
MKWKMGLLRITFFLIAISACKVHMQSLEPSTENYDLYFSTYIGGSNWEHARDVFADSQGNVYIVGGTASSDFPTTTGAYDETFNTGGSQIGSAGQCDAFVMKFSPEGNLIWSTYLGSPNYDRIYAVEVDSQGYVYVAGRAGPGFPVTAGAFQTSFQGIDAGVYGMQNGFAAKLSPDGSQLIWASYVGVGALCRDLAIDSAGDVYVPLAYDGTGGNPPSSWFTNAYQPNRKGGRENGAIKIKSDGTQVLWATWLGGSGDESQEASIRLDNNRNVYLGISTYSSDIPTTPGAHDRTYSGDGKTDFYVAKLSPDGSNLIYGTYLGGLGDQWISTHNLAVDDSGNAYVAVPTGSGFPITSNVFDASYNGGGTDWGVAKLSPTGALIASTFIGGNGGENPDGIYVDGFGNVFVTGETSSTNFPVTANAFQATNNGQDDALLVILSSDFSSLVYSTYMGGPSYDNGRSGFLGDDGSIYLTGSTDGTGWPIKNAYQDYFAGGAASWGAGDDILAKFCTNYPSYCYIFDSHDFDGDGHSDVSVFRPAAGNWFIKDIGSFGWGQTEDIPINGDYDGDGITDIAVWRPSNGRWYIREIEGASWGISGDIPVPGNYDGDVNETTDIAVWRPSTGTWYIKGIEGIHWGTIGDIPVPGDYDGDGTTDVAVWRPSNGRWYVQDIGSEAWGNEGDIPVPGDYDGDGDTDIAVWRPSNGKWYIPGVVASVWGISGDIPVPGDYNGDGKTDIAVWRPSNGRWYIKGMGSIIWGKAGDIPLVR